MRVLERMGSLWIFDMLAPEISFRFNGQRGVRSSIGICLTLCYICSVSVFTYITVLTYLSTDSPTVVTDNSEGGKTHKVQMGEHSLLPIMFMTLDEAIYLDPETAPAYFTFIFSKYRIRSEVNQNGSISLNFVKIDMPVVPCKTLAQNESAFQYYKKYENDSLFTTYGMNYGLCIQGDPNELFIEGLGTENVLDTLIFQALPCKLGASCAPLSTIKRIALLSTNPIATLNVSNFDNPVHYSLNTDAYYYVNEAMNQKYQPKVVLTKIYDEAQNLRNIFKGKVLKKEYFNLDKSSMTSNIRGRDPTQVTCTQLEIDTLQCVPYFQIEYLSTSKFIHVARIYKSFIRTLGEIGGINSFAFLLFFYINRVYCYFAQKRIMLDKVFGIFSEEDHRRNKRKAGNGKDKKMGNDSSIGSNKTGKGLYRGLLRDMDDNSYSKMKGDAYAMVEESLDVVNISKYMITLRVVFDLILKQYHRKLAPLMALKLDGKRIGMKRRAIRKKSSVGGSHKSPKIDWNQYQDEDYGIEKCFSILEDAESELFEPLDTNEREKRGSNWFNNYVDEFFIKRFQKISMNERRDINNDDHQIINGSIIKEDTLLRKSLAEDDNKASNSNLLNSDLQVKIEGVELELDISKKSYNQKFNGVAEKEFDRLHSETNLAVGAEKNHIGLKNIEFTTRVIGNSTELKIKDDHINLHKKPMRKFMKSNLVKGQSRLAQPP